jgi:DNA-binding transcriptional regulator GbsR (MarR family)
MKLDEAKGQFIQAWGTLGGNWGISRTMSQVHALLLLANAPLSSDDIMAELQISRGNVNMNVRALIEWGLVFKILKPGDRKEYFAAEKDINKVAKQIAKERRKRELQPVLAILADVKQLDDPTESTADEFLTMVDDLEQFTSRVDRTLDKFIKSDENWFYKQLMGLL